LEEQSAVVHGPHILDGIFIGNKVVDEIKMKRKLGFIFKVDYEKAYDLKDWNFPLHVMDCMGFSPQVERVN
jgi:hypothetical protein